MDNKIDKSYLLPSVDIKIEYDVKNNKLVGITPVNKSNDDIVTLDNIIAELIVKINSFKGVKTIYSCGGHEDNRGAYILFKHNNKAYGLAKRILSLSYKFHKEVKQINSIHQSIMLEVSNATVGSEYKGKFNLVLRFDGNRISRKDRAKLFNYIKDSLDE